LWESQARAAYEQSSSLGLFHLFLTKSWFTAMKQWTNQKLALKGTLVTSLRKITDGETCLVGTCCFNNVDATNPFYLKQAIEALKSKLRGSWV
jgi:hypothetical protein